MAVFFILLPIAIVMAGVALVAFLWAVRRGQYDDMQTPPIRMLFDDEPVKPKDDPVTPQDATPPSDIATKTDAPPPDSRNDARQ